MLNDYIQEYLCIWKSIFKLNEPLSRKSFWLFFGVNYLGYMVCDFFSIYFFNLFWLLFMGSSFLAGIKRMNDINLPWIYVLIPFYNLYLLTQKGVDKQDSGYIPLDKNAHLNLKSFGMAFAFSVITVITVLIYSRSHGGGGFINIGAVIAVGLIAVVFFLCCFGIIRLIAYYIVKEKIYPNILFQILLPFLVLTYIIFIIYGTVYFEPFGIDQDFVMLLKKFGKLFIPYTAGYTIITGIIFSFGHNQNRIIPNKSLRNNLLFALFVAILSVATLFMFYNNNKIEQPEIDKKYLSYKSLKEIISSENYKIELLLPNNEYRYASKPYFLKNSNEIIINTLWSINDDENKPTELENSYKINKEGMIISEISSSVLESPDVFAIVFDQGYLRDDNSTVVLTWTFDGNRKKLKYKDLKKNKSWKIEMLSKDSTSIKEVAFWRKSKFHCNAIDAIQYNGTKYYDLIKANDILKIRIDSVYSHTDNIENCTEEKITYYECKGMNFSLLCLGEREYYIIRPIKK
jgi:hypothetical protein